MGYRGAPPRAISRAAPASPGRLALGQAAADAVRKGRFEPARSGSVAVAVWVVIPVEFRLKNDF